MVVVLVRSGRSHVSVAVEVVLVRFPELYSTSPVHIIRNPMLSRRYSSRRRRLILPLLG